jgi:hypothetical protein
MLVDLRILLIGVQRESSRGPYFMAQLLSLEFCMVFAWLLPYKDILFAFLCSGIEVCWIHSLEKRFRDMSSTHQYIGLYLCCFDILHILMCWSSDF